MEARIRKWGNSLALRIPQSLATQVGLKLDATVEMIPRGEELVIALVKLPDAVDDEGESYGSVVLAIDAGEAAHFNSDDLESGNAAKGLSDGVGFKARAIGGCSSRATWTLKCCRTSGPPTGS